MRVEELTAMAIEITLFPGEMYKLHPSTLKIDIARW
jgi:hypothetical protein